NACTVGDSCASGACTAGSALSCDDGDLCTDDFCDPNSGCVFGPVPCWSIAGTATVTGLGGIVVDPAPPRFATTLVLRPDGTYRLPSTGITDCGPEIPDEVGTYRRGRRRRAAAPPRLALHGLRRALLPAPRDLRQVHERADGGRAPRPARHALQLHLRPLPALRLDARRAHRLRRRAGRSPRGATRAAP